MRPLFYIIIKSIKNGFTELKRKPIKLIAYAVFLALLTLSLVFGGKGADKEKLLSIEIYGSVATAIILLFSVPELLASLNSGATFFRAADINLVFTSPVRPQKVLVYGFIKQIYNSFIAVFFLLFQIPNLYRFKNIKPYGILIIITGLFIMLIMNSIIKILLYSLASRNAKNRSLIRNTFIILGILAAAAYFLSLYSFKSPGKALIFILNHKVISYIPVYGWTKEILMAAIIGISLSTYIYIFLIVAFSILCIYILYCMNLDYYEDVISSTELKETAIAATRSGQKAVINTGKKSRIRKVEYTTKGQGASAIFWRHILEYKKTGFGFINIATGFYIVLAVSAGFFAPVKDLRIVIGIMVYVHMIFTFASKWQQDLSNPYVYMLPDSAFKKVVYSTVVDNLKNLIDGSIVFLITGILFKSNILLILINIAAFVSIGALFIYGGVLTRRVLGNANNIIFVSLMRFGLLILIILPGIVIFITLNVINNTLIGQFMAYIVFIAYNLLFSSIIILLSKGIFENIEL